MLGTLPSLWSVTKNIDYVTYFGFKGITLMFKLNRCDKSGCRVTDIICVLLAKNFKCRLCKVWASLSYTMAAESPAMQILLSRCFIIRSPICPVWHQTTSSTHKCHVHCATPYKQTRVLLWEGAVTHCNNCQASDRCACWRKWSAQDFPCNIRPTIRWGLFEPLLWEFLVSLLFCVS